MNVKNLKPAKGSVALSVGALGIAILLQGLIYGWPRIGQLLPITVPLAAIFVPAGCLLLSRPGSGISKIIKAFCLFGIAHLCLTFLVPSF